MLCFADVWTALIYQRQVSGLCQSVCAFMLSD
jgi:hypothetical protein